MTVRAMSSIRPHRKVIVHRVAVISGSETGRPTSHAQLKVVSLCIAGQDPDLATASVQ